MHDATRATLKLGLAVLIGAGALGASPDAAATMRSYGFESAAPVIEFLSKPSAGVRSEAGVGAPILVDGQKRTSEHLRTRAPCRTSRGEVPAANDFVPFGANREGRYYVPFVGGRLGTPEALGLFVPADPKARVEAYFYPRSGLSLDRMETLPCDGDVGLERFDHVEFGSRGLRRELVFRGVSQGRVKLTYREYPDRASRPALSEDAEYDLRAGREVEFKGARLRIITADQSRITYVVLKPMPRQG